VTGPNEGRKGRKEGRPNIGRIEGRKEGRKGYMKEGRKDYRKEGRMNDRTT
jgi:hypothetical protein